MAIRQRRGQTLPALSLGLIIGILSLLIHGTTDGNLQIPANALWFVTFLTLCWVTRYIVSAEADASAPAKPKRQAPRASQRLPL